MERKKEKGEGRKKGGLQSGKKETRGEKGKSQDKGKGKTNYRLYVICDIELRELQSYIVLLSIANVYYTCYY